MKRGFKEFIIPGKYGYEEMAQDKRHKVREKVDHRIFLATGYMGSGLTMGYLAGQCMAELILTGACPKLPRRLWPERLRSLS